MVGLVVLLVVFAGVVWVAATNSQADALERSDPLLNPPGDHIGVEGYPIHLRRFGPSRGEPFLLLHDDTQVGGLSLVLLGEDLAERGRSAVVPDLLGFGLSGRPVDPGRHYTIAGQAEMVAGLLDELGLENVPVVGFGWGGGVAAELTVTRPDLVSELVLVDTADLPPPSGRWDSLEALPFGIGDAVAHNIEGASQSARDRFFAGCEEEGWCDLDVVQEGYRRSVEVPNTSASIRARRASGRASVASDRIEEISVPVTIVRSTNAGRAESEAEDLAARFEEAAVETIGGAAHRVALAAPAELGRLLAGEN